MFLINSILKMKTIILILLLKSFISFKLLINFNTIFRLSDISRSVWILLNPHIRDIQVLILILYPSNGVIRVLVLILYPSIVDIQHQFIIIQAAEISRFFLRPSFCFKTSLHPDPNVNLVLMVLIFPVNSLDF